MTLEQKIAPALIEAMKSKNQGALRALRAIKAEILLYNTSGATEPLDSKGEIKILQKMVKQRKESLSIYEEQAREDLAEKEREEIVVIERFLPEQMDESALRSFVASLLSELGVSGMADMGRVMAEANKRLAGKADGKTVASIVKTLLAS